MGMNCIDKISQPGKKFALLLDPDEYTAQSLIATLYHANELGVDLIFVGGSLVNERIDSTIELIKKNTDLPIILFPGSLMQLSANADATLLLSLISGRNPEYLIGNHVLAAPYLKKVNMEVIPTGYILVEGGNTTSVEYISNTKPIPATKSGLITATAIAGEMMGNKLIYLEAGSGAKKHVPIEVIQEVSRSISVPLIVGGGLRRASDISQVLHAGADIVVVGNAIQKDLSNLSSLVQAFHS